MCLLQILNQKNILRWDYNRYVLSVDSYNEKDVLIISALLDKVIHQQQEIILRLTNKFLNFALTIFRPYVVNRMVKCVWWQSTSIPEKRLHNLKTSLLLTIFVLQPIYLQQVGQLYFSIISNSHGKWQRHSAMPL